MARRAPQQILTLASRSPQRKAILEQLGIEFRVVVPEVDELAEGEPEAVALANARAKAGAVEGDLVLGVDTVVALDGRLYGKPRDEAEAESFLRDLSGREHEVWSAIALNERTAAARTLVRFRTLDEPLIRWYLGAGEWRERAGGYAIQGRGAALVDRIEGDYLNVVGLSASLLLTLEPSLLTPNAQRPTPNRSETAP